MENQTEEKLYTEADLVSFGKFLLSPEREKKIYDFEIEGNVIGDGERMAMARHIFRSVTHAAVCNWKHEQGYSAEADEPHEFSQVKCDLCGKEWVAVRPEGVDKLQCPSCNNTVFFENLFIAGATSVTKTDPALLAKILLRRTAVKRDKGGLITLNENDVIEWFENGDHLREFHETDLM
jgi:hypothetical protein